MLAAPLVVLSMVSSALALPRFSARDQGFNDQDLFDSCPGGPGSAHLERADRCTLHKPLTNPNVRKFVVVGNPQLNCGGGTDPVTVTLGGETSISETTTINVDIGIEIEALKIGGGISNSETQTTTVSKTVSFDIPPRRQAVFVAGQNFNSLNGQVQVNYPDRQFGHFEWYTNTNITRLIPIGGDVQFDVHESDCGTDPTDLSSYNGQ
ncbi:hypothetical protein C8Q77DRAFT_1125696 [Trametes polyzona]|nr:hypothetical protein C8Q77DRAFT_1125696 [Trametes polyzona]